MTASPTAPRREGWIDAGRGMAIVLVTLYHAASWLIAAGFDVGSWAYVNAGLASLRMPLFFTISGVLGYSWLERDWRSLLDRKVLLFAWVFAIWEALSSLVFFLVMPMVAPRTTFLRLGLELTWTPVFPRFELWFIWVLALAFMLAKATRRVPWWLQMVVAAIVSLFAFGSWSTLNIAWEGFAKYYVFFIGGMYLRRYILGFARSVTIGRAVPVVLLWGTGAVLLTLRFGTSTSYLSLPFCVLGLAAGICISYYLAGSRLMRFLGSRTLPIYVCHTPFITLCAYALYSAGLPDRLPSWVGIVAPPLFAIAAIAAALLVQVAAERLAPWLFAPPLVLRRRLFGVSSSRAVVDVPDGAGSGALP